MKPAKPVLRARPFMGRARATTGRVSAVWWARVTRAALRALARLLAVFGILGVLPLAPSPTSLETQHNHMRALWWAASHGHRAAEGADRQPGDAEQSLPQYEPSPVTPPGRESC